MLSTTRSRALPILSRRTNAIASRQFAISATAKQDAAPNKNVADVPQTSTETPIEELVGDAEGTKVMQAPNRSAIWSRSQKPRAIAMTGPRFEQTIMDMQPAPEAAIELIHKQPVTWTHDRYVSCDGGGGALGHPRIFINVDKPQICSCTYCGLPFANEHHRKHLESLPSTSYPLS